MSCFQRYCCGANNYALCIFVDAFQGHYKDSTEPGTRDCRWFAGIYFLGRMMIMYVIFGAVKNGVCYTLAGFSFMAIGMLIILLQPFKSTKVNTYHTLLPFIMASSCFCITLINEVANTAIWMIKPLILLVAFFFILCTGAIGDVSHFGWKFIVRIQSWRIWWLGTEIETTMKTLTSIRHWM